MASAFMALLLFFFCFSFVLASSNLSLDIVKERAKEEVILLDLGFGRRALMGFKETPNGGNITYDCSPSGPCVPCAYSEKNNKIYRCSETGYRILLKCIEAESHSVEADDSKKTPKARSMLENMVTEVEVDANIYTDEALNSSAAKRSLLDESSTETNGRQPYVTYRSCIPAVNEEKLSVLRFEGIMLCLLLISGSAIYFKRRKANTVPSGAVRVPNNSRF